MSKETTMEINTEYEMKLGAFHEELEARLKTAEKDIKLVKEALKQTKQVIELMNDRLKKTEKRAAKAVARHGLR